MTILEAQLDNFQKYKVTITRRGADKNFIRFIEEVGEFAKAIRRGDQPNMEEEGADVFAWLITLASVHNFDLEAAYLRKYGKRECFRCDHHPCDCGERGV